MLKNTYTYQEFLLEAFPQISNKQIIEITFQVTEDCNAHIVIKLIKVKKVYLLKMLKFLLMKFLPEEKNLIFLQMKKRLLALWLTLLEENLFYRWI